LKMSSDGAKPWAILDCGSGSTKYGFSSDELPQTLKTVVGTPMFESCANGCSETNSKLIVDPEQPGVCHLSWPMERGVVTDMDAMCKVWDHILFKEMKACITGEDADIDGVFLTEPCLNETKNREDVAKYWFEGQSAPKLYVGLQAACAFLAHGKKDGLSVHSGYGVTEVVPVTNYTGVSHAYQRIDWGAYDIDNWFKRGLHQAEIYLETSSDRMILSDMKEKVCDLADYGQYAADPMNSATKEYVLPDSTTVHLGLTAMQHVPEIMFNPMIAGKDTLGIHHLAKKAIDACDMDTRGELLKNIVAGGGNTMFANFLPRMTAEMKGIFGSDAEINIESLTGNGMNDAWLGAKILASVSQFSNPKDTNGVPTEPKMWISKAEYDEIGPSCMSRMSQSG